LMKAIAACSILKIMLTFWISLLFGKTCISQVMNWNNNQSENTDRILGAMQLQKYVDVLLLPVVMYFLPYAFII
jgi:hypothetical protein